MIELSTTPFRDENGVTTTWFETFKRDRSQMTADNPRLSTVKDPDFTLLFKVSQHLQKCSLATWTDRPLEGIAVFPFSKA